MRLILCLVFLCSCTLVDEKQRDEEILMLLKGGELWVEKDMQGAHP